MASTGGLFVHKDSQQDTPNEQTSLFEYADGTVLEFATRGLYTNKEGDNLIRYVNGNLPLSPEYGPVTVVDHPNNKPATEV